MCNLGNFFFLPFLALVLSSAVGSKAYATSELDRKYALETVGYLRALDNIDGLFSDYVSAAYKDYFSHQSRFVLQDLTKTDAVLSQAKIPYSKVIQDSQILGQISRTTRSQSMIRTKIRKEGPQYRFSFEWLHSPQMDVLANEEFIIQDRSDGQGLGLDEIKAKIQASLDKMIKKVPFLGMVTGRDHSSVTINIGTSMQLKSGDTLAIATLDEVKKHPLLHEIVEWRLTPTGKINIEQVEDSLAFGKITEEEPNRPIARYQKIVQLLPKAASADANSVINEKKEEIVDLESPPALGWMRGTALLGSFNRQFSHSGTLAKNGSAMTFGAEAEGQLWLTREWFTELGFSYGFFSYSQSDIITGTPVAGSMSGSLSDLKFALGYTYLVTGDSYGPKAFVKLGYHSLSYSLPILASEGLAPISFKTPYLGIGAELPFREKWGAQLNLDFGLFSGASEVGDTNGAVNSASDVRFFMGGYYRWKPRMTLRAGFEIFGNSADYSTGSSLSQKIVTFAPSLLYYF